MAADKSHHVPHCEGAVYVLNSLFHPLPLPVAFSSVNILPLIFTAISAVSLPVSLLRLTKKPVTKFHKYLLTSRVVLESEPQTN